MNTPAHAVLNLALLERGARADVGVWVIVGAVLPDVPNGLFFAYHRFALGLDPTFIYEHLYPSATWQAVLAPWHSVWLVLALLALARWRRSAAAVGLALSMGLHLLADLVTHTGDAHPHLYPVSDLRFVSPISYWDAAAGARWFVPLELLGVMAASAVAWRRGNQWWRRLLLAASCVWLLVAYLAGWSFWGTG
ncbi:MAG: hypothetical protein AAF721_02125 [Myxococcota bacterium]